MELCTSKQKRLIGVLVELKSVELERLAYWNWGNWKLAVTVTLICWNTQAVWNLFGFKSSFFDHHFVSVVGFWYRHYFVPNCGFEFFDCWWRRICLSKLQLRNWLFTMSMWNLTSNDDQTTAHEHAETPDERAMRSPQASSTMLGAHGKESGYSTREIIT